MTEISLISTRCPPDRHTQKGQLRNSARVSTLPHLSHLLLRSEGERRWSPRDSQGMCMSRHGPRPAALAPRVGLAYFQHSAPGAFKKNLFGERDGEPLNDCSIAPA